MHSGTQYGLTNAKPAAPWDNHRSSKGLIRKKRPGIWLF